MQARKLIVVAGVLGSVGVAHAQIPDLLNSLDAGGRAMGLGGGTYASGSDTFSTLSNPAGLAYVSGRNANVTLRNLPGSTTTQTGSFVTGSRSTESNTGHLAVSHIGITLPVTRKGRQAGTIGVSYTVGGYIRDERVGNGPLVIDATSSYANYFELNRAKVDYFTLGYGTSVSDNWSVGASVVLASVGLRNITSYTLLNNGSPAGTGGGSSSSTGTGVAAVIGAQYLPPKSNAVVGVSVRTPMNLTGNGSGAAFYDRIPGKITLSAATRKDNVRSEGDYFLFGGSLDTTFRNNSTQGYDRKRRVNVGAGFEYGYLTGAARIPIRLGFVANPAAGTNFDDRNALTFGVGYRPLNQPYSIDLNFASAKSGRMDTALSLSFRF